MMCQFASSPGDVPEKLLVLPSEAEVKWELGGFYVNEIAHYASIPFFSGCLVSSLV